MNTSRRRRSVVAALALSLVIGACGSSDDDSAANSSDTTAAADATSDDTDASSSDTETESSDTETASTEAASGDTVAATADGLDTQLPPLGDDPVEISFESYNFLMAGAGADTLNSLLDEFEEMYPNISIERRSPTDVTNLVAGVQQQLIVGDPPSLSQLLFNVDLVANDLGATSWQDLVGADTLEAYFEGTLYDQHPVHPNARTLGDYNDQTYILPWVFSTPTLFINRTIFEEAGLDADTPLTTWDEVADAARTISENTDADGMFVDCTSPPSFGWCYQAILRSNGSVPISDDRTTLSFDDAQAVDTANTFAGWVGEGIVPDLSSADASDLFLRGNLGMHMTSSVATGSVMEASSTNGWEMDATGLPSFGDQPIAPTNSGSGLVMFAQDPQQQRAAWELAKFLTSDHAYVEITSKIGYLPLRNGIVEVEGDDGLADWLSTHPFLQDNLDQLDQLVPWIVAPGANGQQITTIWLDAVNEVIYNGADAQSTLTDAQERSVGLMP